MKKYISAMLAASMLTAVIPCIASADGGTVISITAGPGYQSDVNHNGMTVTPEINVVNGETPAGYKYQWYAQDNWSTEYKLPWETGPSITLGTQVPIGYYLNFEATPLDSSGNAIGDTVKATHYISNSPMKGKNDKPSPTAAQSSAYASTPSEYTFEVDGVKLILLDLRYNGGYYVMMEDSVGKRKFDTDNTKAIKYDPTVSTSVAYWLNNDFLSGDYLPESVKSHITEENWPTDYNTSYGVSNQTYRIGLLSYSEYLQYMGRFGFALSDYTSADGWEAFWLRSSYRSSANNNKIYVCSENGTLGNLKEYSPDSGSGYVRPTFRLSEDFFKDVRVENAGAKVAEIVNEKTGETVISITAGPGYQADVNHNSMVVTPEINVVSGKAPAGYKYQWYQGDSGEYILPWETEASIKIHSQLKSGWLWFEATPLDAEGNAIGKSVKVRYISTYPMKGNNDFTGPTAAQSAAWHDTPPEYLFEVGGVKLILLDRLYNGQFYVMMENSVTKKAFDSRAGSGKQFDPTAPENIAHWLNNDFLEGDYLPSSLKNQITEGNWTTEGDSPSWGNSNKTYKVGLLSYSEYNRYLGRFGLWVPEYGEHPTDWQGFWLRSLKNNAKAYASAKNGGTDDGTGIMGTLYHYDEQKTANFVRPTFRLSADFFKNVKINTNTMGERIRQILMNECTEEELGELYGDEELSDLGWTLSSFEIYNHTVEGDNTVTAEAVIKNGINNSELPVMLFASYRNGILDEVSAVTKDEAATVNGITTYQLDFDDSVSGKTYKAFLLDSIQGIRPIANCIDTGNVLSIDELDGTCDLHSDLVEEYLADNYNNISDYADGKKSKDAPVPVVLKWNCINSRCAFTLNISENSNMSNAVSYNTGNKTSAQIYNLKVGKAYYWNVSVSFDNGDVYSSDVSSFTTNGDAPRMIYAPGLRNARDVGGWSIDSTKRVKQGLIYRSHCFGYTDNDTGKEVVYINADGIDTLRNSIGIKTEIDLRGENKKTVSLLGDGISYLRYGMGYDDDYMSGNKTAIKNIFDAFADSSNYPIIYHCQAGADRTGVITYLLNGLLGVSKEDLIRDYLFTNFANIGSSRSIEDISNKYIKTLDEYQGSDLSEKIYNYLKNEIGVSESNLNQIKINLTEQKN